MARKITCFEQLQHVSSQMGGAKCAMILPGIGVSNKEIYWDKAQEKFHVINCLDGGSEQRLSWEELFDDKLSCIGSAIRTGVFMTAEERLPESRLIAIDSEIGQFTVDPYTRYVIAPYSRILDEYKALLPDLEDFVPDQLLTDRLTINQSYNLNHFEYIGMTGKTVCEGELEEWLADERMYSGLLM